MIVRRAFITLLGGAGKHGRRHVKSDRLRGFDIDH